MTWNGWFPVLRSRDLGRTAKRVTLDGKDWSIERNGSDLIVRPRNGTAPVDAREQDGLIYLPLGMPGPFCPQGTVLPGDHVWHHRDDVVHSPLIDLAENILDTTHTSVVHAGYLRDANERCTVTPLIEAGSDWIAATYPPAASPSGFVSRLMSPGGYQITDRFRAPAIAEVEYRTGNTLAFAARFILSPVTEEKTKVLATLAVPGRSAAARLKLRFIEHLMGKIIAEDKDILRQLSTNTSARREQKRIIVPCDLLRRGIEAIAAGRTPCVTDAHHALRV